MFNFDKNTVRQLKNQGLLGVPVPTHTVSFGSIKKVDKDPDPARQALIDQGMCPDCGSPAHDGPCSRR